MKILQTRRHISFKIYFRISQVLELKSCINSLKRKLEKILRSQKIVGAVLMDLSKASDSIPHNLLMTKMHAYGFSIDAVTFLYSYLKRRKQNVVVSNTHSVFQILLSGFPQGLILGPPLFNIFVNVCLWISKPDLLNFAGDNTISAAENTIEKLVSTLE